MGVWFKVNDEWVETERPYVKRANAWVPVKEAWVKRSGAWVRAYEYDVTPPDAPLLSLEIIETKYGFGNKVTGSYIKVGVRLPGLTDNAELKKIRVLTTYQGKQPTTPGGGNYISAPAEGTPNEPWSDFMYDTTGRDSSVYDYKRFPRNADVSNMLKPGETYYFSAWAQDDAGNWSPGTHAQIHVPKSGVTTPNIINKEARFSPVWGGSFSGGDWSSGRLIQRSGPMSRGGFGYQHQITSAVGAQGTPTITNAQIFLSRVNDSGAAVANIYIAYHDQVTTPTAALDATGAVKLGRLAKGEAKWFKLPESLWDNLSTDIKGFTFLQKDPDKAAAQTNDFSVLKSISEAPRSGELHVVWREEL